MDTRNVQQTGEMLYLYLPTRWCKRFNLSAKSKIGIQSLPNGSLGLYPQSIEKKPAHLSFRVQSDEPDSLYKLIVAAYISPASTFKITLDKEIDFTKVLNQKNLVSLELVEMDGNKISCESSLQVNDPLSILTTMLRKIRNLLLVMQKDSQKELIERYEEEIDRSKLLIEKSVVSGFYNPVQTTYKAIELHHLSLLSKSLERMVDHLILIEKPNLLFIKKISDSLNEFQKLLENQCSSLNCETALEFNNKINLLQKIKVEDVTTYSIKRIVRALNAISEVIIDWAVMKEVERS